MGALELAASSSANGDRLVIGRQDRRYEVERVISHGGMGTVHLGRRLGPVAFPQRVAIKSLRPDHAANPAVREMFLDEARLTARLRHANIASTLDVVVEQRAVHVVMEYIDGCSLDELWRAAKQQRRRLPLDVACAIAHDALLGLDHAHDATDEHLGPLGLVHCDVSPQNLRVGADGVTRILDFGIARATDQLTTGSRVAKLHGKIPYMAPEQLKAASVDRRADIYAVGVLLWEMLVGTRLFHARSPAALCSEVLTAKIDPPGARVSGVPSELDALVMKALSREPRDRFASAGEMAQRLTKAVSLAPRSRITAAFHELAPPEYTPTSGIHAFARPTPDTPPARAMDDAPAPPSGNGHLRRRLLVVFGIGLVCFAVGAVTRRAAVQRATTTAPPPAASAEKAPPPIASTPAPSTAATTPPSEPPATSAPPPTARPKRSTPAPAPPPPARGAWLNRR